LARRGYTPGTIRNVLKDLGQICQWLSAEELIQRITHEERIAVLRQATGRLEEPAVSGESGLGPHPALEGFDETTDHGPAGYLCFVNFK
jgi:hypothetical protein